MSVPRVKTMRLGPEEVELALEATRALERRVEGVGRDREAMGRFLRRPSNVLVVAVEGERPIGFLLAYVLDRIETERVMVCLYEIIVDPDRRRRGIGTRMMETLGEVGAEVEATKIWTITNESNRAAVRLFTGTGAERDPGGDEAVFTFEPDPAAGPRP